MPITALDHIYMESKNYDQVRAFWLGLGFAVTSEWGEDGHRACRLDAEKAGVVLAEAADDSTPLPMVYLSLTDTAAMNAQITDNEAVEIIMPLEDTHWGTQWMHVRDPDGNVWVLESQKD